MWSYCKACTQWVSTGHFGQPPRVRCHVCGAPFEAKSAA